MTDTSEQTDTIHILVVDDHPIVRAGIIGALSDIPDLLVVGEASSGPEAVRLVEAHHVDVVLMDLRMPGGDGVAATAEITATHPDTRVLILTTYESDDSILAAIEAGASGYLLKASPESEIVSGIRSVARGGTVLAPTIAAALVSRMRTPTPPRMPHPTLSARELEVLRVVAAGKTNGQIATALHISEATVKTHLVRAFEKLGVGDRTRAVTLAIELGLLPGERSIRADD
ncbi:response regulator transcription factor [Klugiella xanthotipulae]|uniref:LuxR family two component transcriptional regulator n=1 Tax=Klugiella xanthotipulae TaxID=244735 RepID=A0A543I5N5_9MICO|nr:response regulator transcription factor [Klugiella xanthotipulae]TQM65905.1 LuxR family two component transcriptional regulator [Klugiella xanthotipulae]